MSRNDMTVFDRALLRVRRSRAAGTMPEADFLLQAVAREMVERLGLIKRDFGVAVDLGSHTGRLADAMTALGNVGMVIRTDPVWSLLRGSAHPALVCEEDVLPFAPKALDLVAAPLSLHLVNDLPGALAQIAQALKPDGLLLAAVLGGDTLTELRQVLLEAESELSGGAAPRVAPFIDVRDMGALLQRAGLALPVTDTDRLTVTYADMFALIRDLRAMGMTNMLAARSRSALSRAIVMRAAALYQERYATPQGRIRATFQIVYAAGWKPDDSQQKPLAPGSARQRLADALGVEEKAFRRD